MKDLESIMITGGGTGGHIMPAIALCQFVQQAYPSCHLHYAGRPDSMESRLAIGYEVPFVPVRSAAWQGGAHPISCLWQNFCGFWQSIYWILKYKPYAVVGFGGYTCAPLLLASLLLHKKTIIHESNAIPGKVTRWMTKHGAYCACGFASDDHLMQSLKAMARSTNHFAVTGNPLRFDFYKTANDLEKILPGWQPDAHLIVVFGGSQGSHKINEFMSTIVGPLTQEITDLQIVHITGAHDYPATVAAYEKANCRFWIFPFFREISQLLAHATLAVTRAGALSVTELCVSGTPAILIPFPTAADNHQMANAEVLSKAGAAVILPENSLTEERLMHQMSALLQDPERLAAMRHAGHRLVKGNSAQSLMEFIMDEGE